MDDVDAIAPAVGFAVFAGELRQSGVDLDHRHARDGSEMEEREPDRPDAGPEIDRMTCASSPTRLAVLEDAGANAASRSASTLTR